MGRTVAVCHSEEGAKPGREGQRSTSEGALPGLPGFWAERLCARGRRPGSFCPGSCPRGREFHGVCSPSLAHEVFAELLLCARPFLGTAGRQRARLVS